MNFIHKLSCLILLGATHTFAATPYLAYVFPAGAQVGTTTTVLVGGQYIGGEVSAHVTGPGVKVIKVETVPSFPSAGMPASQRKWLIEWAEQLAHSPCPRPPYPAADKTFAEWRECEWWEKLDQLSPFARSLVEMDLHIRRNALQMSPSLKQMALVTLEIAPDAPATWRSLTLITPGGISVPHLFHLTTVPRIPEPLYAPPARAKKHPPYVRTTLPAILDGRIMPGETDRFELTLRRGERIHLRCTARALEPWIGDAVPGFFNAVMRLVAPDGKELAFADDRAFDPDPIIDCVVPADGVYTLEVRDNLYRGREDFVYEIEARNDASAPPPCVLHLNEAPCDPIFETTSWVERNETKIHEVQLTAGEWVVECIARQKRSPLDPVVKVRAPRPWWQLFGKGEEIAQWDDTTNSVFVGTIAQAECDVEGRFTAKQDGKYSIEVNDRTANGGSDYMYRLVVRRAMPHAVVLANKSTFALFNWTREQMKLRIVRKEGFNGMLKLSSTAPLDFAPNEIPATTNEMQIVVMPRGRKITNDCFTACSIIATAPNGIRTTVVPCDETTQAFAWTHLVPQENFLLNLRTYHPKPFAQPTWPAAPDRSQPGGIARASKRWLFPSNIVTQIETAGAAPLERLRNMNAMLTIDQRKKVPTPFTQEEVTASYYRWRGEACWLIAAQSPKGLQRTIKMPAYTSQAFLMDIITGEIHTLKIGKDYRTLNLNLQPGHHYFYITTGRPRPNKKEKRK